MSKENGYYNCGGYALQTYDWYMPYKYGFQRKCYRKGFDRYHKYMVLFMLKEFPNIRIAKDIDDRLPNERLVAFRTGFEDFHFVKITSGKRFYHKLGTADVARMSAREFFSDQWYGGYDSEITYLAIKKD
jgi:hypothetical protein